MGLEDFLWEPQEEGMEKRDVVRGTFPFKPLAATVRVYFKETGNKICSVSETFLFSSSNILALVKLHKKTQFRFTFSLAFWWENKRWFCWGFLFN